ncbi:hypothetical protein PWT90_08908 [Aphanocladium album]|nr:hypothetical protein PWT90_08908 [Aphanocladium album]
MKLHIEQSGREFSKLKELGKKVVDKAHEAKSQRWLPPTTFILQRQTKIEEMLVEIQKMRTQFGGIKKQMEEVLEAVLQKLDHLQTQTPSGEVAAVTPPQTPSSALRTDDVAASSAQTPTALHSKAIRNSRASPPPIATPARRQRSSRDIAPQSPASSSQLSISPPILRSERTGDMQYTVDTSQEDIYTAGEEFRMDNGGHEESSNPAHSPTYTGKAIWGHHELACAKETEEQQGLIDSTWNRIIPAGDDSILPELHCGNLGPTATATSKLTVLDVARFTRSFESYELSTSMCKKRGGLKMPCEGMVVCVPIEIDEYRAWTRGVARSESLEALWEHGILASVSEQSASKPWCPKEVLFSNSRNRKRRAVMLVTHEYMHPDLPPEEDDRSNRVPFQFVVLLYFSGRIKEAIQSVQDMRSKRPTAGGAGATDAGGARQFGTPRR